jgi:hypothetical protein
MEKVREEEETDTEMRKGKVGEELEGGKKNWKEGDWQWTDGERRRRTGDGEELEMEKNTGEKDKKNLW